MHEAAGAPPPPLTNGACAAAQSTSAVALRGILQARSLASQLHRERAIVDRSTDMSGGAAVRSTSTTPLPSARPGRPRLGRRRSRSRRYQSKLGAEARPQPKKRHQKRLQRGRQPVRRRISNVETPVSQRRQPSHLSPAGCRAVPSAVSHPGHARSAGEQKTINKERTRENPVTRSQSSGPLGALHVLQVPPGPVDVSYRLHSKCSKCLLQWRVEESLRLGGFPASATLR